MPANVPARRRVFKFVHVPTQRWTLRPREKIAEFELDGVVDDGVAQRQIVMKTGKLEWLKLEREKSIGVAAITQARHAPRKVALHALETTNVLPRAWRPHLRTVL